MDHFSAATHFPPPQPRTSDPSYNQLLFPPMAFNSYYYVCCLSSPDGDVKFSDSRDLYFVR